jgi:hypothetical protein
MVPLPSWGVSCCAAAVHDKESRGTLIGRCAKPHLLQQVVHGELSAAGLAAGVVWSCICQWACSAVCWVHLLLGQLLQPTARDCSCPLRWVVACRQLQEPNWFLVMYA